MFKIEHPIIKATELAHYKDIYQKDYIDNYSFSDEVIDLYNCLEI